MAKPAFHSADQRSTSWAYPAKFSCLEERVEGIAITFTRKEKKHDVHVSLILIKK